MKRRTLLPSLPYASRRLPQGVLGSVWAVAPEGERAALLRAVVKPEYQKLTCDRHKAKCIARDVMAIIVSDMLDRDARLRNIILAFENLHREVDPISYLARDIETSAPLIKKMAERFSTRNCAPVTDLQQLKWLNELSPEVEKQISNRYYRHLRAVSSK